MQLRIIVLGAAAGAALISLTGCDNGPSAVAARSRGPAAQASYDSGSDSATSGGSRYERTTYSNRNSAGPQRNTDGSQNQRGDTTSSGWAGSRKYPAAESAAFHFQRDGVDFGASNVEDYVSKAKAFVSHPPRGVERLEKKNGDTLLYDPKSNVFAVVSRDGASRTMFKPHAGADYWAQQKARESGGGRSRSGASDDQRG